MKYKGKENIKEYIMQISYIASKQKALKLELSEDLLVHLVLISLPTQFSQFKVSYNCQEEKWTLNELISYCVQEEKRLKHEKSESTHLVSTAKDKGKKKKKDEAAKGSGPNENCFFCKKPGHIKERMYKISYLACQERYALYFDLF